MTQTASEGENDVIGKIKYFFDKTIFVTESESKFLDFTDTQM